MMYEADDARHFFKMCLCSPTTGQLQTSASRGGTLFFCSACCCAVWCEWRRWCESSTHPARRYNRGKFFQFSEINFQVCLEEHCGAGCYATINRHQINICSYSELCGHHDGGAESEFSIWWRDWGDCSILSYGLNTYQWLCYSLNGAGCSYKLQLL